MRPALGKGKFVCLHDNDNTPRTLATNRGPMWKRLREMGSNSKRWVSDGINNVKVHLALPGLEGSGCIAGSCTAPDAVVTPPWPFGELWVKVSSEPIPKPGRILVAAPPQVSSSCQGLTKPLPEIPSSVRHLRLLLVELFGGDC